jgi:hypothetical protein
LGQKTYNDFCELGQKTVLNPLSCSSLPSLSLLLPSNSSVSFPIFPFLSLDPSSSPSLLSFSFFLALPHFLSLVSKSLQQRFVGKEGERES